MNNIKEPIFKDYKNSLIAASAKWYITPVDDNTRPIANYAPFDSYQLTNNSASDISAALNGSLNKKVTIFAGCGVLMTGHKYEWLLIENLDTSNSIAANKLDLQVGVGISGEMIAVEGGI